MAQSDQSRILFSERLSTGIMVHFADGDSVLFLAEFLYDQRLLPPNKLFRADEPSSVPGDSKRIHCVRPLER